MYVEYSTTVDVENVDVEKDDKLQVFRGGLDGDNMALLHIESRFSGNNLYVSFVPEAIPALEKLIAVLQEIEKGKD